MVNFLRHLCKNVWFLQLVAAFFPRGGPMSELLNIYSYVNILFYFNLVTMNILAKHFALIFLSLSLSPQVSDQLEQFSG